MPKILMVCMGNVCRSPMAEEVTRVLAGKAGLANVFELDSAGTHVRELGEAPDRRAQQVAAGRGYDISRQRARQVIVRDFSHFDLVLAMDRDNLDTLQRRCPELYRAKLGLFLAYAGAAAGDEIPDPYFGNIAGFERVLDLCEMAATGLIQKCAESIVRHDG